MLGPANNQTYNRTEPMQRLGYHQFGHEVGSIGTVVESHDRLLLGCVEHDEAFGCCSDLKHGAHQHFT